LHYATYVLDPLHDNKQTIGKELLPGPIFRVFC
jgi:hypothetical protein